ncbi:hypothetical protein [Streptomyces sp. AK010]|uniref:hypothetical protein n=1 Tax=Streptomyces sp. AK010 TaxID=2723074 RepID=UPI001619A634|nr:hypothetical protein [Streptomyces sp. AK010]MBB6418813.1 ABC-type sugar transport system substrate-binding protein [Streptomyces sp. AK010]
MARHDSPKKPAARRALAVLATAGVALGAGTASAAADTESLLGVVNSRPTSLGKIDPRSGLQAATGTLGYATGPVAGLKPDPLAGTGVDPLGNGVGTGLADFKPMTSQALTGPVAQARSMGSIPVVGQAVGLLSQQ